MTILYYKETFDYACEVSEPVARMAINRSPDTFCRYEDIESARWRDGYNEFGLQDHANYADDFDPDFLKPGGTA